MRKQMQACILGIILTAIEICSCLELVSVVDAFTYNKSGVKQQGLESY